jgi:hypothetical protein
MTSIKPIKLCFNLLVLSSFIYILLLPSINTLAQGVGRGLIVTPPIMQINLEKGQSQDFQIGLENDSTNDNLNIKTYINKVDMTEDDTPLLNDISSNDELNSWVSLAENNLTFKSLEKKTVTFRARVPENTQFGGQAFAVIFEPINQEVKAQNQSGISIKQRLSTLVFLSVPSEQKSSYEIIKSKSNQWLVDPFFDSLSLEFVIKNTGNGFVKFKPELMQNDTTINQEVAEKIVLIGKDRTFKFNELTVPNLKNNQWLGYNDYKFQGKDNLKITILFFPWKVILIGLLSLILISTAIYVVRNNTRQSTKKDF